MESYLAAPEYGGNKDLKGWKRTGYQGDVMPLGYSFWDSFGIVGNKSIIHP